MDGFKVKVIDNVVVTVISDNEDDHKKRAGREMKEPKTDNKTTLKQRLLEFFRPRAYISDVMRAMGLALLIAGMMAIADGEHIGVGAITALIGFALRVQFNPVDSDETHDTDARGEIDKREAGYFLG